MGNQGSVDNLLKKCKAGTLTAEEALKQYQKQSEENNASFETALAAIETAGKAKGSGSSDSLKVSVTLPNGVKIELDATGKESVNLAQLTRELTTSFSSMNKTSNMPRPTSSGAGGAATGNQMEKYQI
jgi:hypothetical protein